MSDRVPLQEIKFSFVRSSGPGGQNVNKVSSKAVLQWKVETSKFLKPGAKTRFLEKFEKRITADGILIIQSDKFRDQLRNKRECLLKLRAMIEVALTPPKKRIATKTPQGAKEKRLRSKKVKSAKKQSRRVVVED